VPGGLSVSYDAVDPIGTTSTADDYEPPTVFDLGDVFEVTKGSSDGSADANAQGMS
jgi:hypothetical protein